MNLQRREEIREMIDDPDKYTKDPDLRGALIELLAHIDTLEQRAAERVIADGKVPSVVMPELDADLIHPLIQWTPGFRVKMEETAQAINAWFRKNSRSIPADRVLGEGMAALRRFAERCAQRDHQPDEHIGSDKCVACEAEDALRANHGGADHG